MESKKADEIKNLLLKIIIPLAFPLAGSFICDLIAKGENRNSNQASSDSSIQLDQSSYGSSSTHGEEEEEDEEEEMESPDHASRKLVQAEIPCSTGGLFSCGRARQASLTGEIMVAEDTGSSSEVAVDNRKFQYDQRSVEDVESLKRAVSALDERVASIESQFHDYCDMKEQESTYQKMQIMCLGMKLELLESQNQRLEATAAEIRSAAEEFATMRAKLDMLQSKFKKSWKRSKQEFGAIDARILALDAQEAEMVRRCQGFEQHMKEMELLALQLQKENGTNSENVEVIVERSMRKLSSSKDLMGGLEAIRDRWAADMEELIYLGWITAWLQHDLLVGDGSSMAAIGVDGDGPPATGLKKGERMVAVAAPTNEVELFSASASASASSGGAGEEEHDDEKEACMGRTGCRTGIGRPRLLHKLRGWAKGKGPTKSGRPCSIEGPPGSPM